MPIALPPTLIRRAALVALVLLLAACASRAPAPVVERQAMPPRPTTGVPSPPPPPAPTETEARAAAYTVKRGDTLIQIALDQGLDYRDLAAWNGIDNPNLIRVGQVLRLAPPGEAVTGTTTAPLRAPPPIATDARPAPAAGAAPSTTAAAGAGVGAAASPAPQPAGPRNADNFKVAPKALKEPYSEQAARDIARAATTSEPAAPAVVARADPAPRPPPPVAPSTTGDADKLDWMWPAQGKVVSGFSETANLKGIDIAAAAGTPVVASAAGKVVYSGSGLRGYGKLVIIKHNENYLSAYAHNREIVVKEGDPVARGQKIAEMGNTDADQVKLHFEIRRLGKPMDPLKYLPPG